MANPVVNTKKRAAAIQWEKNPDWTNISLAVLKDDPKLRLKLFSDSTQDAKKEGRTKTVGADGKKQLFGQFAKKVFEHSDMKTKYPDVVTEYEKDPQRYASLLQQRYDRLRKLYREYRGKLKETGKGVEAGDEACNSIVQTRKLFPFWDDLHAFWCELPNYNPVGVSTADSGVDHAAHTEALFSSSRASSAGVDSLGEEELAEMANDPDADDDEGEEPSNFSSYASSLFGGEGEEDVALDESIPPKPSKTETKPSMPPAVSKSRSGTINKSKNTLGHATKKHAIEIFDDNTKEEAQCIEAMRNDRVTLKRKDQEIKMMRVSNKRAKLDAEDRDKDRAFREREQTYTAQQRDKDRQHEILMGLLQSGVDAKELRGMGLLPPSSLDTNDPFKLGYSM
ncbi:hypothetical protein MIND_01270000 [Mycena indigotica]|uniref:Uncharacterized protein n=1 Tax=Mycena indigotica TaxID=2126181 RepID=A0A8H6S2J1_9AGAR|nr:uncharacterized protein MIND_01270000 [Mycena indigotica]KAF7291262.1 hypothetical protein MIND_01270000 [Mycena indigotica]